jgi:hypothetical protein
MRADPTLGQLLVAEAVEPPAGEAVGLLLADGSQVRVAAEGTEAGDLPPLDSSCVPSGQPAHVAAAWTGNPPLPPSPPGTTTGTLHAPVPGLVMTAATNARRPEGARVVVGAPRAGVRWSRGGRI